MQGLNSRLYGKKNKGNDYAQYLKDVNEILSGELGLSILDEMKKHGDVYINQISNQKAIQLRVLDNVLMLKGGRWR